MSLFNPLDYPIIFSEPMRSPGDSAWREHMPFAEYIIDVLRPKCFVELGTYAGASYCAFCQAVKQLELNTSCSAIDTWQGESQAGFFGTRGATILDDLRKHHDPLYGTFSHLIQSTFDEALPKFGNRSVDLLHIDGFHSYEAVKHDYCSWLPKMSSCGVVLFHDIFVVKDGFGVHQFWDEIKSDFPHFEFRHGHGLGVLAVGEDFPQNFSNFLQSSLEEADRIRLFFSRYGATMSALGEQHMSKQRLDNMEQQWTELSNSKTGRAVKTMKRIRRLFVR